MVVGAFILIEPVGIETNNVRKEREPTSQILIEPVGIETKEERENIRPLLYFNRTSWN